MVKNPFSPKNVFGHRIFNPFVKAINNLSKGSSSDKDSQEQSQKQNTIIENGNSIVEVNDGFIRIGVLPVDGQSINLGVEIDKTTSAVTIINGNSHFSFNATALDKLNDIVSKYDLIMALS